MTASDCQANLLEGIVLEHMSQKPLIDFALLAPVPWKHLKSGQKTVQAKGRVAFGSQAVKLFQKLDKHRNNMPVDVYIYASDDPGAKLDFEVSWYARYIGHVQSEAGGHPGKNRYRPESATSDTAWDVFWEVDELEPLLPRILVAKLSGFGNGKTPKKTYSSAFAPRRPLIIMHPTK